MGVILIHTHNRILTIATKFMQISKILLVWSVGRNWSTYGEMCVEWKSSSQCLTNSPNNHNCRYSHEHPYAYWTVMLICLLAWSKYLKYVVLFSIVDQAANFESRRVHIDNLFRMVSYCENVSDCRRCQILQYFGECSFTRDRCAAVKGALCDNCEIKVWFCL